MKPLSYLQTIHLLNIIPQFYFTTITLLQLLPQQQKLLDTDRHFIFLLSHLFCSVRKKILIQFRFLFFRGSQLHNVFLLMRSAAEPAPLIFLKKESY